MTSFLFVLTSLPPPPPPPPLPPDDGDDDDDGRELRSSTRRPAFDSVLGGTVHTSREASAGGGSESGAAAPGCFAALARFDVVAWGCLAGGSGLAVDVPDDVMRGAGVE